ncbi:hypothetical protein ACLB2K_047778 [Fragaria x ananassa]
MTATSYHSPGLSFTIFVCRLVPVIYDLSRKTSPCGFSQSYVPGAHLNASSPRNLCVCYISKGGRELRNSVYIAIILHIYIHDQDLPSQAEEFGYL